MSKSRDLQNHKRHQQRGNVLVQTILGQQCRHQCCSTQDVVEDGCVCIEHLILQKRNDERHIHHCQKSRRSLKIGSVEKAGPDNPTKIPQVNIPSQQALLVHRIA